ncbi:HTRA2-related serine protease [Megachile rotundata]|uniref:HTRA2-related serine protease n=1 Tax=Megachile rotundata TaxID=143995 RepID=UPI000258DB31|nr:PREDICTED: serine protease HTRA2, mitochondrial [Megachile rotundata]
MAAPITRFSWNVLKKSQLQYKQLLTLSYATQSGKYKHSSSQEKRFQILDNTVRNVLLCTVFFTGCGYILYKWQTDYPNRFSNWMRSIFTIHAKSLNFDGNNNRMKYNFIADVVETTAPSVVHIEIQNNKTYDFITGLPSRIASGSGFIVRSDGLILTNAHVVTNKPNTTVKVRLHDGTTYVGTVEDMDMHCDLASVRIKQTNLPVMKLGSSQDLRPGEFVVAIGSPLTLTNTITSGVISSVNRDSKELGLYHKQLGYIQTDATVTDGSSGGPLVNLNGEAIGVNVMKVTSGISFAIPIDYAKDFLKRAEARRSKSGTKNIVEEHKTKYIGVTLLTLTPDLIYALQKKSRGMPDINHGVLIYKVIAGSPAHLGGLQPGDVVTYVNDEPVMTSASIYKAIETTKILRMTVIRGFQVLYLKIEPEET